MVNDTFWKTWRWLPWVLPPVFLALRIFSGGGWESLFLLIYSPVIIIVTGLLGWLPRFILKKRGFTSAPTTCVLLLAAYWSSMVWFLLALPLMGDTNSSPSFVRSVVALMSARHEAAFQQCALIVIALTGVATLVVSMVLEPPAAQGEELVASRHATRWWRLGVLVLTPLVIFGASSLIEAQALHGAVDAAGNQQADVVGLSLDEARALQEQRWQALQELVVGLRESIATDGWNPRATRVPDNSGAQYDVNVTWDVAVSPDDPVATIASLTDRVAAAGWQINRDQSTEYMVAATGSDGTRLTASIIPPDAGEEGSRIRLQATSPKYWSERATVRWRLVEDASYPADEWPALVARPSS